jgi:hypothetical protein
MQLQILIDDAALARLRASLGDMEHKAESAVSGAINETTAEQKTSIARKIYEKVNLTSGRIKKDIHIVRATPKKLAGSVRLEHQRRIGLRQFGARQTRKGVSYQIARGGARKTARHAFIATAKGAEHVFERKVIGGKRVGRLPLRRLMGVSAWGAFVKAGLVDQQFIEANQSFEKNLTQRRNAIVGGFIRERRGAA